MLLPANGSITVDDTSDTSLYLTNDAVADAINNLHTLGSISVSGASGAFPRATGIPQILHGDGSPEGLVYSGQGSLYMRRDSTGADSLYTKTTGTTLATGWQLFNTGSGAAPARKTTAKAVTNTVTDTDLLNGEISIAANALGTTSLLRLTAWGDWLQNSGANSSIPVFTLKFGGTSLLKTGAPANVVAPSATRFGWRVVCEVMNLGAANAQSAYLEAAVAIYYNSQAQATFTTGEGTTGIATQSGQGRSTGYNAGAVDTSSGCALVLLVVNPTATATCETTLHGALIEII